MCVDSGGDQVSGRCPTTGSTIERQNMPGFLKYLLWLNMLGMLAGIYTSG
ncbi:hypothetical protein [Nocardia carnea]|nr:hypothetical protein [Nocardia carnea]